jgi:hypothetical protein
LYGTSSLGWDGTVATGCGNAASMSQTLFFGFFPAPCVSRVNFQHIAFQYGAHYAKLMWMAFFSILRGVLGVLRACLVFGSRQWIQGVFQANSAVILFALPIFNPCNYIPHARVKSNKNKRITE